MDVDHDRSLGSQANPIEISEDEVIEKKEGEDTQEGEVEVGLDKRMGDNGQVHKGVSLFIRRKKIHNALSLVKGRRMETRKKELKGMLKPVKIARRQQ
jgi:hypothetical protein